MVYDDNNNNNDSYDGRRDEPFYMCWKSIIFSAIIAIIGISLAWYGLFIQPIDYLFFVLMLLILIQVLGMFAINKYQQRKEEEEANNKKRDKFWYSNY